MSQTQPDQPGDGQAFQPVVISAPFGHYVQPAGATATLGTFTADARPGRLWRTLCTVRYYRRLGAWVNRIGLRNPGLAWLEHRVKTGRMNVADKMVSIHGFDQQQWSTLLDRVARLEPLAIELNMSCPNVGQIDWPIGLFAQAVACGRTVVVKLPPVQYVPMAAAAVDAGVTTFHCCNTLPVRAGGMSGKPLMPLSLACIRDLRNRIGDRLTIIGGGGITEPSDVDAYLDAGANHVALGTKTMHPRYLFSDRGVRTLIDHAAVRLEDHDATGI